MIKNGSDSNLHRDTDDLGALEIFSFILFHT